VREWSESGSGGESGGSPYTEKVEAFLFLAMVYNLAIPMAQHATIAGGTTVKLLRKCRKYLTIMSPSLLLAKDLMKTTLDFDQQGMFVALYCTLCFLSRFFMP
jgi:hypothetical protein